MRITKFTHSCVRLEDAGRVLVIDPGVWSEAGALIGADAVLVTHEHVDHLDTLRLAGVGVPVFTPAAVYGGGSSCANLGYVVGESAYHPGDSLHVPGAGLDMLNHHPAANTTNGYRHLAPRESL